MKVLKKLIFVIFLMFSFETAFSQTTDTLFFYPNPFTTSGTIHFSIVQTDTISLRVFDVVGRTIRTYFQSTILPSGSYNINVLGDSLKAGVYIIRLDIGKAKRLSVKALKGISTNSIAKTNDKKSS